MTPSLPQKGPGPGHWIAPLVEPLLLAVVPELVELVELVELLEVLVGPLQKSGVPAGFTLHPAVQYSAELGLWPAPGQWYSVLTAPPCTPSDAQNAPTPGQTGSEPLEPELPPVELAEVGPAAAPLLVAGWLPPDDAAADPDEAGEVALEPDEVLPLVDDAPVVEAVEAVVARPDAEDAPEIPGLEDVVDPQAANAPSRMRHVVWRMAAPVPGWSIIWPTVNELLNPPIGGQEHQPARCRGVAGDARRVRRRR